MKWISNYIVFVNYNFTAASQTSIKKMRCKLRKENKIKKMSNNVIFLVPALYGFRLAWTGHTCHLSAICFPYLYFYKTMPRIVHGIASRDYRSSLFCVNPLGLVWFSCFRMLDNICPLSFFSSKWRVSFLMWNLSWIEKSGNLVVDNFYSRAGDSSQ